MELFIGESLFSFIVGNGHVDEIIDLVFFFGRQGFNILDPPDELFIHDHVSGTGNQVIDRDPQFIGDLFCRLNGNGKLCSNPLQAKGSFHIPENQARKMLGMKKGAVETPFCGSYWTRTSDLFHVKEAL